MESAPSENVVCAWQSTGCQFIIFYFGFRDTPSVSGGRSVSGRGRGRVVSGRIVSRGGRRTVSRGGRAKMLVSRNRREVSGRAGRDGWMTPGEPGMMTVVVGGRVVSRGYGGYPGVPGA